ncbi:MAG: DUF4360 domain-containing protein [Thiobacillus sp.]|nr:DUF4360 domain-containing protein [Thiobacillus sp.]
MKLMIKSIFACTMLASLPALALEANGCPTGSYSIVTSPDGTSLSILFDQFTIENNSNPASGKPKKVCRITTPLNLPANYSIGVYKVDYRGFAKLAAKQATQLEVQYFLGPHDNEHGRVFKRKIKGPHEDDYLFTENIGAGQMKRVGCGTAAMLNVAITLSLDGDLQAGGAMASLDTSDAAPGGALIYHLNLKKCP